jgi:hypothetical protein
MIEKIYKDEYSQMSIFINQNNKIVLNIYNPAEPDEIYYTGLLELDEQMAIDLIQELQEQLQLLRAYNILK